MCGSFAFPSPDGLSHYEPAQQASAIMALSWRVSSSIAIEPATLMGRDLTYLPTVSAGIQGWVREYLYSACPPSQPDHRHADQAQRRRGRTRNREVRAHAQMETVGQRRVDTAGDDGRVRRAGDARRKIATARRSESDSHTRCPRPGPSGSGQPGQPAERGLG
jgi:hypothetical protein